MLSSRVSGVLRSTWRTAAAGHRFYQHKQRNVDQAAADKKAAALSAKIVDLRSDVLSKPPPEMIRVMVETAHYGDDVLGECLSVNNLEARVAKMYGKEAGLFVPSGTMANMLAIMAFCRIIGSEVIIGDKCHVILHEQGTLASLAGVHHREVATKPDGTLCLEECESLVRLAPDAPHFPVTRALCLENTQAAVGGKVLPVKYFAEARKFCDRHGIKLFLDGARLFNAAVAAKVDPIEYTKYVDAVTISLTKSVCAPVGSCIAADAETIQICRRLRKALGGSSRQPGLLAAAANYGLDHVDEYAANDNANAYAIYSSFSSLKAPSWLVMDKPETNIVLLHLTRDAPINIDKLQCLLEEPTAECPIVVKIPAVNASTIRFVTHNDVNRRDCEMVGEKIAYILASLR